MRTTNALLTAAPPTFVAIDFETADYGRDSACTLARQTSLVPLQLRQLTHQLHRLHADIDHAQQ